MSQGTEHPDAVVDRVIEARPRDLGGFAVSRVLPSVGRRSVGPFVFLDHMLPVHSGTVTVRPHPHIHLGTVTYLFEGEIVHRDSLGSHQVIQPGAINWMTAGRGIVHSERTPPAATGTPHHGLQLWVGLPRALEDSPPSFAHHPAATLPVVDGDGIRARVLIGEAFGARSPVEMPWPMVYVDCELAAGARLRIAPGVSERAAYVVSGVVEIDGQRIVPQRLAVLTRGADAVIEAVGASARLVVLGGEPLDGPRYMWWNFVSSTPDRIVAAANDWRAGKFPTIAEDAIESIPAPDDDPRFALTYERPDDAALRSWLLEARTIAIVGASADPAKPSHAIMAQLLAAGYRVIPVNPKEQAVLGQPAVASLRDIREPVDIVDVFRRSEDTPAVAEDAAAIGARVLWLQLGVVNDAAARRALAAGMRVVMDTCIGATHRRLHVPPKR